MTLHAHGITVVQRAEAFAVPFDAIDQQWLELDADGAIEAVVLVDFDRRCVRIDASIDDFATIAAALDREVTTPLEREARAALMRGERLVFGPIGIDRDAIEGPDFRHRFREVVRVRIVLGRIVFVHGVMATHEFELASLPHAMIACRLLADLAPRFEIDGAAPFTVR